MKVKLKANTILLIIGSFIGLSLLLYPWFSDFWNRNFATHVIDTYVSNLQNLDESVYQPLWNAAIEYNRKLLDRKDPFSLPEELEEEYDSILRVEDTSIMGFIEIPKMDVTLPIYHTVSDSVLQMAIGHIPWSSVPTGGLGTHSVFSGHRGLPSAKLFTDLNLLKEGDIFMLRVLNELLTYEVDQIRVVEPYDASDMLIEEDKDYCSLVTCTPYGINTHRLVVRGHRVPNTITVTVVSEAVLIDQLLVGLSIAAVFVFILIMIVMLQKPKPKKKPIHYEDIRASRGEDR